KNTAHSGFFKNCMKPSKTERKNGTYEKLICESVMTVFHIDKWKKSPKAMDSYLNDQSNNNEFKTIKGYFDILESICGENYQDIFVAKNIAVWISIFDKFKKLNLDDNKFVEFLNAFKNHLYSVDVSKFNTSWDKLDG